MFNKNIKNNFKIFAILYVLGFIVFNWQDVSWLFNYKAIAGITYEYFNPYYNKDVVEAYYQNQVLPNPTLPDTRINNSVTLNNNLLENIYFEYTDKDKILEIPSIGLETEIVFPKTKDINDLYKYLDSGVIYYPDSALPNQVGEITILGHSAPPGWPKIKHDTVFSNLDKLKFGQEIYLNLDNKKYTYIVRDTKIIDKGQEIENSLTNNTNVIMLVSCYPPGKDYKRIVVFAEIQTKQ